MFEIISGIFNQHISIFSGHSATYHNNCILPEECNLYVNYVNVNVNYKWNKFGNSWKFNVFNKFFQDNWSTDSFFETFYLCNVKRWIEYE